MAPPASAFPTTRWTLILGARAGAAARRRALEELLAIYWRPLYVYLRRRGVPAASAEDLVQGFVIHLLESPEFLERLHPSRGHFRGYLKKALDHYRANLYAREKALKRGGGLTLVPLDVALAERELAAIPEAADGAYDREWAMQVMQRCVHRLGEEFAQGRRADRAPVVLRFFSLDEAPSYAESASECGMTVPQFKAALHRARVRFRQLLREEVADTVAADVDVERELGELMRALSA
jgi:RNA polymerase sigma-70 factor (ECF subfamily)